ncbi:prepilin-type N-terminal cleavage/methylation domain-containing protein [Candidatus Omnitrophota bacterium]
MRIKKRYIKRAFTLIELLIAVSIFSAVGVVLYSCFRGGVVSWRRIDAQQSSQLRMRYCFDTLSRDLKNMLFISNIPFKGEADRLSFISSVRAQDDNRIYTKEVSYYAGQGDGVISSGSLSRSESQLKDKFIIVDLESDESKLPNKPEQDAQVILNGVSELKFSYLSASEESANLGETEYEWLDFWDDESALPMGVRIDLTLTDIDSGDQISISKRIWIPVGRPSSGVVTDSSLEVK